MQVGSWRTLYLSKIIVDFLELLSIVMDISTHEKKPGITMEIISRDVSNSKIDLK